jgi:tetratricopeptide (TPR) repeat protein
MVTFRKLMVSFSALGAVTNCSIALHAQDAAPAGIATLYSKQGVVESRTDANAAWGEAAQGSPFQQSYAVRVGENGRAGIKFADGMLVRLGSKAFLEFNTPGGQAQQPELNLASGKGYFFNRAPGTRPTIKTPVVSAAIRGTEFAIEVGKDTSKITVIDGQVSAKNEFGEVTAGKGEQVSVKRGSAPVKEVVVDLQNQIQWALYYPSVSAVEDLFDGATLQRHKSLLESGRTTRATLANCSGKTIVDRDVCAAALADQGKVDDALALLQKDSSPVGNAVASGLYLSIGQTEQAESRISLIESSAAANAQVKSIASAQRAIISLSKGDVAKARMLADNASKLAPKGSSAALALAYVLQAQGDTPGAYKVLSNAKRHHALDAMLLARLAEHELGLNHPSVARKLVDSAKEINPNLAYARMVDGYLLLIEGRREKAIGVFENVTENDPGLSAAQLGLGLAKIGTGDSSGGRSHVEQAVHLSPSTGSYRSYLGKAFFEEDNYDKARGEYDLAVKLDSEDPTPYLYRAFLSLAENDPVYALSDVLESVDKNENRSVFRSRELLDQDKAVRSASLARVYNDLGFVELGRIEAIKAISKDYTNYSAHRLLAGAYSQDLFTARAATNETLISNLLAPPSLNLFFSNGDKTTTGNYTSLYDRNEQRSELTTENSTLQDSLGGSATSTGKIGNLGYGVRAAQTSAFGSKNGSYDRSTTLSTTGKWEIAPDRHVSA